MPKPKPQKAPLFEEAERREIRIEATGELLSGAREFVVFTHNAAEWASMTPDQRLLATLKALSGSVDISYEVIG